MSTLLGNWTAPAGGTVSNVVIGGGPGAYTIDVKAPCTPDPVRLGHAPADHLRAGRGIKVGKIGSATYNQGFVTRIVVVTAQDATAPFLRVDVYSKFTGRRAFQLRHHANAALADARA